jgi:hypothetical protein
MNDEDDDYEPPDMCREESKHVCFAHSKCSCGLRYDHIGQHYCPSCGWVWGRGKPPTRAAKDEANR